jgi:hypothetical protein
VYVVGAYVYAPFGEVVAVDKSIGLGRLMRWGTGALVLLLAHGLGAPAAARAGCNHLVTSQSDRLLDINRLDDLIAGSSAPLDGPGQPGPRPPGPCSGPGCSSSIPRPASTTTPGSGDPDQWAALEAARDSAVLAPPRLVPDEPAARPAGHKLSIFHPPPA